MGLFDEFHDSVDFCWSVLIAHLCMYNVHVQHIRLGWT